MGFPGSWKKYIVISIILIFLVIIAGGVSYLRNGRVKFLLWEREGIYSQQEFMMDTIVTVKIADTKSRSEPALTETFHEMRRWADQLDRFKPTSVISRINHSQGKPVKVTEEVIYLLKQTREYSRISKQAFDPTIAPLIELWGFGQEKQRVPEAEEINQLLLKTDYRQLILNPADNTVLLPAGMSLDLGGAAKGFVVDQGVKKLLALGIKSAYINAGGTIRVIGNKAPGQCWSIGIRKPQIAEEGKGSAYFDNYIVKLNQGSLATSGDYERYFIEEGVRYSHLLDPRTGYPVRELKSATIYAEQALLADILSTAVFVLGWQQGQELINSLPGIEGFLVRDGEVWSSEGFTDLTE